MSDTSAPVTLTITVNGAEVQANPRELVIDACERNGVYIPRFCYHPRMRPVGMCRMCLVEIDTGRGPALQPSCMIEVSPNMVVDTESPVAKKAQDGILEFLLINHPLDCPVCDKGGECPLQDQTLAYGPGESRFIEEKRHFEKPIPISDLVYLDRERCILCDRCTRFASEVAGDPLIHFLGRGNHTEVNTFPGDPFASYFSGNTVQICPVGALTAKPYRFKARPWDLEEVESTSVVDSVGSRIAVQSSRNNVLRILGIDSDPVNWGWLSDKERFSFEATNNEARLGAPLLRGDALGKLDPHGEELVRATWSQALGAAASALRDTAPERIGVIGGARLTNEAAYAWAKLVKGVIGTDNVDCQLGDGLPAEVVLGLPRATIDEACAPGGVVVLLGPDAKEELGALYLRLRHAVINDRVTLIELTPRSTGLSSLAAHRLHYHPGEVAALAAALVASSAPPKAVAGVEPAAISAAGAALRSGAPVTVLLGRPSLAEGAGHVVDAALALRDALPVRFLSTLRRGNVHGALDMGLSPGLLPGRTTLDVGRARFAGVWPQVPSSAGLDTAGILDAAAEGRISTLVLLGADPLCDFPDRELAKRALARADTVIAVDLFVNDSGRHADVVLAAAGPTEVDGSFTNIEGRVTALHQKVTPPGTARADWIIAAELAYSLGHDLGLESTALIRAEIAAVSPTHAALADDGIDAREGVLITGSDLTPTALPTPKPAADAYSLRLVATRSMYDLGTFLRHSASSAHLAPGTGVRLNPADFDRLDVAPDDDVVVSSPRGSLMVPANPDPGVPRGSAAMLINQPNADVLTLVDGRATVTDVRVERGMILGLDPLFFDDVSIGDIVLSLVKVLFILVALIVSVMLMIWFERKIVADMQNRLGPNKAGPWGILQTLADGMKLIFKEDLVPDNADRFVFKLAPYLSVIPAFVTFSIIPLGGDFSDAKGGIVHIFDRDTFLQVADPPIGLLLFLAMSSVAVYGIMLAGWSSGSKYPLLGSVRATAQMISYEAALGLSAGAVFLQSGSLSTHDIVASQWHWDWNLWVTGFVPFVIFLIAGTAELNRPPFDLVEAEQELVGGFHTEYSAARFAMFYVAEFMNVITMSAIIITLFFGGPNGPMFGPEWLQALLPTMWFFAKLLVFLLLFVAIRNTLPRFRYDQLMDLGWKLLIPLALFWFVLLGAIDVGRDEDWNPVIVPLVAAAALLVGAVLLLGAIRTARLARARDEVPV